MEAVHACGEHVLHVEGACSPRLLPGELVSERHITEPPPQPARTTFAYGRRCAATGRPSEPRLSSPPSQKVPLSALLGLAPRSRGQEPHS